MMAAMLEAVPLTGNHVRLEPLEERHVEALARASSGADADLYRWSFVPIGVDAVRGYVQTALRLAAEGSAAPFAIVRLSDEAVVGSTRFFNIEYWQRPQGHPLHGQSAPDACEIGYTWLNQSAIGTAINTEAKYLLLRHAFEQWNVERVCLHTDVRNTRSRRAIERIGATFEGVLRAHRMAVDYGARDSARYSIVAEEWPPVRERLLQSMNRICVRKHYQVPQDVLWRIITTASDFGAWFGMNLDGEFVLHHPVLGRLPGAGALVEITVEEIVPLRTFSFFWKTVTPERLADSAQDRATRMTFTMEESGNGTLLTIDESGFEAVDTARRSRALEDANRGWTAQLANIENYAHRVT